MFASASTLLCALIGFAAISSGYGVDTPFEKAASYEAQTRQELFSYDTDAINTGYLDDTVLIAIFVRNKEHSLPYFFKAIEDLDYDKKRIRIWIVCDHTKDDSIQQIEKWVAAMGKLYYSIDFEKPRSPAHYPGQKSEMDWVKERHLRMLELRQLALIKARELWARYILYTDADNILMNPFTLRYLMDKKKIVVAPMLDSVSAYTNFWGGMDEKGYYKRTDEYFPIRNREKNGTFEVPMVHSTYLIDLNRWKSREIQFLPVRTDYQYDFDDIIVFATHCKSVGIPLHVDNTAVYGYLPVPQESHNTLRDEENAFVHLRMEVMTEPPVGIGIEMKKSDHVQDKPVTASKLDFDEIYMINLKRRMDRRLRMKKVLRMQGIKYRVFDAVDSQSLNTSYLRKMGIDMLPGYVDPYRERALTRGEIGCFLSHFTIWTEVLDKGYDTVLVLEDDVRFQPGFVDKINDLMERIKIAEFEWDLIYVGRKRLQNVYEPAVDEMDGLVMPDYSYWTIGYMLSRSGAEKLLDGDPLGRMIPVDEYLPIMYDKHPIQLYKDQFSKRNLLAFSVNPLLIFPTHYTHEINYFSDTETSSIWEEVAEKAGTHEMLEKLKEQPEAANIHQKQEL